MKLRRFISLHKRPVMVVLMIIIAICSYFLFYKFLGFPIWSLFIIYFVTIFFVYALVVNNTFRIFTKPIAELNNKCDPYPLVEEGEKHLKAYSPLFQKCWIFINYAVALHSVGQCEKALEVMLSINIEDEKLKNVTLYKCAYYVRLANICTDLDKKTEADFAYSKFLSLMTELKREKEKKMIEKDAISGKAIDALRKGDYPLIIETLESYVCDTLSSKVNIAMLYGVAYHAMGETDKAKEKFEFVIENGNKLHCVTEAREMLANL